MDTANKWAFYLVIVFSLGLIFYLFQSDFLRSSTSAPAPEQTALEAEEEALDALALEEEAPLSPELEAARKALRALPLEEGSVADKLLNFLLSEKRNFYRELYEFKNHEFTAEQQPSTALEAELKHLGQVLLAYPKLQVELTAHTSQEGSWEDQQNRTQERVDGMKAFLVEMGVETDRLSTSSYGASRPIADEYSDRGKQMNERAELLIRSL